MSTTLVNNSPMGHALTTDITAQVSPSLLRSAVDQRITKIRPSSTPLDQISRLAGGRPCGSMRVEFYAVDLKKGSTTVTTTYTGAVIGRGDTFEIQVKDSSFFAPSDTVMFSSSFLDDVRKCTPLIGYVVSATVRSITVMPANVTFNEDDECALPDIAKDSEVVRMGRAAGELDVQTAPYTLLPSKDFNFCQIFKSQIEESTLQRLADKEVGWTFSDQEEAAILDMRMTMERSFLFGTRNLLTLPDGKDIMLTGGVWNQAKKHYEYTDLSTADSLVPLMRKAFSESNGSPRKILLAGSDLLEKLSAQQITRTASGATRTTKWGIDFDEIVSKFGTLYVVRSEVFDLCGMPDAGIVIDPEYITKYVHIPFNASRISFSKQGLRNTEGVVLTEASCLVLRYPEAHMRITAKRA